MKLFNGNDRVRLRKVNGARSGRTDKASLG
jgi:hypothetical protein